MYLVDYGLAYRYAPEKVLKEYKEDPKRCHDGTIEFTSIDAHKGVCRSKFIACVNLEKTLIMFDPNTVPLAAGGNYTYVASKQCPLHYENIWIG